VVAVDLVQRVTKDIVLLELTYHSQEKRRGRNDKFAESRSWLG
jgi:hypothetical protein